MYKLLNLPTLKHHIVIVIPVNNEQESISLLADRIMAVFQTIDKYYFEVLFVDDGSTDQTIIEIEKLIANNLPVGYLKLSRNFGHQSALDAGLNMLDADLFIMMDGDLQHPPEEIPKMLSAFEAGADVVQMQRKNTEVSIKSFLSICFYTFFKWISNAPIIPNAADFRLISRKVANTLRNVKGNEKLFRALIPSLGFTQVHIEYIQDKRILGTPSYSFSSSFELAIQTVFLFTRFPIQLLSILAALSFALCLLILTVSRFEVFPNQHYSLFFAFALMISGCILLVGSIIGRYQYYIFEQLKNKPSYIIERVVPAKIKH